MKGAKKKLVPILGHGHNWKIGKGGMALFMSQLTVVFFTLFLSGTRRTSVSSAHGKPASDPLVQAAADRQLPDWMVKLQEKRRRSNPMYDMTNQGDMQPHWRK